MKPRKPSHKPKTFLIGRTKRYILTGCLEVGRLGSAFNKLSGFSSMDGYITALCRPAFTEATGIELRPGECREFKLVEVKRKRKVKK